MDFRYKPPLYLEQHCINRKDVVKRAYVDKKFSMETYYAHLYDALKDRIAFAMHHGERKNQQM